MIEHISRLITTLVFLISGLFIFLPSFATPVLAASQFRWPTSGLVGWIFNSGTNYSICGANKHLGLDIWTNSNGTGNNGTNKGNAVYPPANGVIDEIYTANNGTRYGIRIKHDNNTWTHYYHMASGSTSFIENTVQKGTTVDSNTLLGYQGNLTQVNDSTVVHLDFTVTSSPSLCDEIDPTGLYAWNLGGKNLNADLANNVGFMQKSVSQTSSPTPVCEPPYQNTVCVKEELPVAFQVSNGKYWNASSTVGEIKATSASVISNLEKFKIVRINKDYVAIKANSGKYLTAMNGGGGALLATATNLLEWEVFNIIYHDFNLTAEAKSGATWEQFYPELLDGWDVRVDGTAALSWEEFKIEKIGTPYQENGKTVSNVRIRSYNGPYIYAVGGGGNAIQARSYNPSGEWEQFKMVQLETGNPYKVAFKTSKGTYLGANNGGGSNMLSTASSIDIWETFNLVAKGGNRYAIKSYKGNYWKVNPGKVALKTYHGSYMQAVNGGGSSVNTNAAAPATYETFTLAGQSTGYNMVKLTASNGQILAAENGGGGAINANRTNASAWETFNFSFYAGAKPGWINIRTYNGSYLSSRQGKVAFKTLNGKYLEALNGGGGLVNAQAPWDSTWQRFTMHRL